MENGLCTMCSNIFTMRCGTCESSQYCSVACLNADRPTHQILCGELKKFAKPPNKSARRGIFFPVDEEAPPFLWATAHWLPDEDGCGGWENLTIEPYGDTISVKFVIWANYIRSRPRDDQVRVYMKDTCPIDRSKVNRSIAAVTGGTASFDWRGGMLAMKLPTLEVDPPRFGHMDMMDFRDVVDFFRSYGSEINMSDESCNKNHKGAASPLDDLLKLAETSNSKIEKSTSVLQPSSPADEVLQILNLGDLKVARWGLVHASSSYKGSFDEMLDNIDLGTIEDMLQTNRDLRAASSSSGKALDSSDLRSISPVKDKVSKKKKKKGKNKNMPIPQSERALSGVRINCDGDCQSGRAKFEPIKVPRDDPVWSASIPGISRLVDLPLRVRRIQSDEPPPPGTWKWRKKRAAFDDENEAVTLLHTNVNPNAEDWGLPTPAEWRMPAGSAVVVCEDSTVEVLPVHVEALCAFCQCVLHDLHPVLEDSTGMGARVGCGVSRSDVLRKLTPREFQHFCQRFRNWKGVDDPTYKREGFSSMLSKVN